MCLTGRSFLQCLLQQKSKQDVFHTFLRHWEEWEMSQAELEMSQRFSFHLDINSRQDCCVIRILQCQLLFPTSCLHTCAQIRAEAPGDGFLFVNPQYTWQAGTWCKSQYKGGKELSIKILKLSNGLMALNYFISVNTTWPLASLYCKCTVMTLHPPHMASTINLFDAWLTLFPNWFLGRRSNDSNCTVWKHYKGPNLPTTL